MIDVVFDGCVLKTAKHQLLDLYKQEKEQLSIRSDINLPKEIREAINEQGKLMGSDHFVNIIDLSVGGMSGTIMNKKI